MPFVIADGALAFPLNVTESTVQFRLKAESRDDRFFQQTYWGDRDIFAEWRLRGNTSLVSGRFRLDAELQDQRVAGSHPPVWLDASPMPSPPTTYEDAGLRLAGKLRYTFRFGELAAGRFVADAAGGRLLGRDEYGAGYRPTAIGFTTAERWGSDAHDAHDDWRPSPNLGGSSDGDTDIAEGTTVWFAVHSWNDLVGPTLVGLAKHAERIGRFELEAGILGRRSPSRPLYSGLRELTGTPYVFWQTPLGSRFAWELTAAYQFGRRAYHTQPNALRADFAVRDGGYGQKYTRYFTGDSGDRRVQAGFLMTSVGYRLPLSWEPVVSAGFHAGAGGGSDDVDGSFHPFVHDTHRFFGLAGYFGERNVRAGNLALAVPFRNGWALRLAAWKVEVLSTSEGLILENDAPLDPATFTRAKRERAMSHDALKEWDAQLSWSPASTPVRFRLGYAEVRHGAYLAEVMRAGDSRFTLPPAQWASMLVEVTL